MKILAIDLGQSNSAACSFSTHTGEYKFQTFKTNPQDLTRLLQLTKPQRVVIEICPLAGWVSDLVREHHIEIQVADTSGAAWQYHKIKRKTDRDDALKLAHLSALNQLNLVHMPARAMRQWRQLIAFRAALVAEQTRIKNRIRALLLSQALHLPPGKQAWTKTQREALLYQARALPLCDPDNLWRGLLWTELQHLTQLDTLRAQVEAKLDDLARQDHRVRLVQTIPGVGPRTAEAMVTAIDDPHRFANARQVSCYVGLTPRRWQSGRTDHSGHISKRGNRLLRQLLDQAAWIALGCNPWAQHTYHRICHRRRDRKKIAITAVSRKLFVIAWAMLRDGRAWRPLKPAKLAALAA
jgi:transposase